MIQLPSHACSLTLEHNEHKNSYQTVAEYLAHIDGDLYDWPSNEEKQKAIDANELWTLQWYPRTPVSFIAVAAATLETLLEFANRSE